MFVRSLSKVVILSVVFLSFSQIVFAKTRVTIEYLEKQVEKLGERGKDKVRADLLYQLGEKYFQRKNYKKAAVYIRKSLEIEERLHAEGKAEPKNKSNFIPRVHTRVALASVLIQLKDLDGARKLYSEAVDVLEQMNKPGEASKLACHLGNLEIKTGNFEGARKYFQKANALAIESKAVESQVTALIGLATIDRINKENVKAVEKLLQAKKIGDLELDGIAYGRLLNELGRTYSDMSLYEKALEYYLQAAKEFESNGELVFKAGVLTSIGEVYLAQRDPDKALQTLNQAFDILKREKEPRLLAKLLLPYGSALSENGETEKAIKYHKLAQKLAKQMGDSNTQILALSEEGYDYFLKGDVENALKKSLKANKFIEKYKGHVKPELKASILRDCGMGFRTLGQMKAAIQYYNDAAESYERAKQPTEQAGMLESVAVAYLDQGDVDQFNKFHMKAKAIFDKSATDDTTSRKLLKARGALNYNQGQYHVFQGKYADAILQFEKALKDCRQSGDQLGHCHALRGLGLAYLMLGQDSKSKNCYEEAAVIASRIGNIESQWDCATGLGKAYIKLGDNQKAEEQLRKAVSLADKERRQFSRDNFKTLQLNLREDCFLELVDLLVREGKTEQALAVAESGRARAFLDMLEGRRHNGISGKKVAYVTSNLLDDSGEKSESRPLLIAMASPSSGEAGFRSVKVKPKSKVLVSPSAISSANAKAPTLEELKTLAKNSSSYFIEYITTPKRIIIWMVDANGNLVTTKSLDYNISELKKLIRSTYMSIVTTPKGMEELHKLNEDRSVALKKLYSVLVKPIEEHLPEDPEQVVTVVPYGALYLVPYAALINEDNQFMIEKHTLAYLPSIAVLRATSKLKTEASGLNDSLLAFGNPITEANKFLGALPYSKDEVEKVAELFNNQNTKIEIGQEATKKKFRDLAPSYSYIHLATHGLINPDSPMDSSVVLAPESGDDGLLSVKDILELPRLKAKLVVLSACQTGKGKVTGDGVIGLSRAFIIAGTPSIMVSQWNVDDVMTQYQMTLLYKELLSGKKKAQSLRTAQLKTIAFMEKGLSSSFSDDSQSGSKVPKLRANPRYWAAFQIIGEHD